MIMSSKLEKVNYFVVKSTKKKKVYKWENFYKGKKKWQRQI